MVERRKVTKLLKRHLNLQTIIQVIVVQMQVRCLFLQRQLVMAVTLLANPMDPLPPHPLTKVNLKQTMKNSAKL
jgi:hypothetical protein